MTDKDLHKLSREDLLKLMLTQSKEVTRQKAMVSELTETREQNTATIDRLKNKLDEKDETIERLKERLNENDALLEKLKKRLDEKDKLLEEKQEELDRNRPDAPKFDEHVISLQRENADLRQQNGELNGKVGELKARLAQREEELQRCKERLEKSAVVQSDADLGDLDLLMDDFNAKNRKLLDQLDAKEAQLEALCRQAAEREGLEETLSRQLTELKEEFAQSAPVSADTQAFARELRDQLAELKAGLAQSGAGTGTADMDAFRAELRDQMASLRASLAYSGGTADPAAADRLQEKDKTIQALNVKLEERDNEIRELWSRIWTLVSPKG